MPSWAGSTTATNGLLEANRILAPFRLPLDAPAGARATFFLEMRADEVSRLAAIGSRPARDLQGFILVATAPCLRLAAARMLGRSGSPSAGA